MKIQIMWFYIIKGTFGAIQMSAFFNPHSIQIEEQASLLSFIQCLELRPNRQRYQDNFCQTNELLSAS